MKDFYKNFVTYIPQTKDLWVLRSVYKISPASPLFLFLTLVGLCIVSFLLFNFMWEQPDTPSYANGAKRLFGFDGEADRLQRLSKPLSLLLPAILYAVFGLDTIYGLWIQELTGYLLCGFLMFHILCSFIPNREHAYLGTLAYMMCQPMAIFGVLPMIDSWGWATSLGGILLSIRVLNRNAFSFWSFSALGWYLGLGFFVKESILVAGAFLFVSILLEKDSIQSKLKFYLVVGLSFAVAILLMSLFTDAIYGVTFLTWLDFNYTDPIQYEQPVRAYALQTFRSLDLYWLLVMVGLFIFVRQWKRGILPKRHISFVGTGLSCLAIYPFVWPYYFDRIIFMLAPFFMLLVTMSLSYIRRFAVLTILTAGISNLMLAYGIYAYQIKGLIATALGGYSFFLLGVLLYNAAFLHSWHFKKR